MRITSRTRRTAALMAVSTVGLSTLVLGVTGVASASDDEYDFTFSTDPSDAPYVDHAIAPGGTLSIPAGYCSIDWTVQGAAGGDSDAPGGEGTTLEGTTILDRTATVFGLFPGVTGTDGNDGGAGGTNGHGDDGGHGVDDGAGQLGGGGGAASTVVHAASPFLEAPGGAGGDGANSSGGGAGGGTLQLHSGVTATGTAYADGVISGTAVPCPGAPSVNWVEGGDHSIDFQLDSGYLPDGVDITDLQYSLDGGAWTTATGVDVDSYGYQYEGSIPGLTTAQQYSVQFRFLTTGEISNVSGAQTATPRLPAPGNVAAVVGPSSITVSWTAPAGNSSPIANYTASASISGAQSGGEDTPHCTTTTLSCTIVVPAGEAYDVAVHANDAQAGMWSDVVTTGTVPAPSAPATVPTGSGPLSTPSGALGGLAQGSTVTLTGSGYAPNSTVSLFIYSTPTLLGTVVTDGSGSFSATVTIPVSLAPGAHHLVSAGVDPSGNPRYLTSAVTVAQATGTLAWTGFETLPVLGAGVLAVALGAGLIVVARRRRTV